MRFFRVSVPLTERLTEELIMKNIFVSLLATFVLTSTAQAFDRNDFVEQLSLDRCAAAPEHIYLDLNNPDFDFTNALSFSWIALQTLDDDPDTIDPETDITRLTDQWHLTQVKIDRQSALESQGYDCQLPRLCISDFPSHPLQS